MKDMQACCYQYLIWKYITLKKASSYMERQAQNTKQNKAARLRMTVHESETFIARS